LSVSDQTLRTHEAAPSILGTVRPGALVVLMVICQIVAWTLAPALTHSSPPLDVVEGYMWGREWVLATYKHPAMPSWVLEASRLATGVVGWPAYLISQLFVAASFVFVYLLGRDLLGSSRAAAGVLLMSGVAFYAWPTTEFNHNVAAMLFWAALSWAMWRAVERGSMWWALVGAFAAGGMYAKLSTGFLLMALSGWMVWDRDARRCLATPGPWLALLIFAALVAPLAQWLLAHDFAPLHYGATRARTAQGGVLQFLVTLLLTAAGLFLVLGIAGLIGLRAPAQMALSPQQPPVTARVKRYLVAVTGGPLALALIGAVASGSSLKVAWGSSMLNLAGLLAVALTRNRFTEKALCRIAACALALLIVLPLGYAGVVVAWPLRTTGRHLRANWPQAEISRRFVDLWTRQTGQPLRIVSGDPWIAGLIGITATDNPSIWNGPEPSASPWITPERLKREGMLVVWDAERQRVAPHVLERIGSTPVGQERFRWNSAGTREDLVIAYVIVLPQPDRR